MTYIWCLYAKNWNPIKSINKTSRNYTKYNAEAKHYLRGQIWGQANFWSQAKSLFGANFEAKIGTRPTLKSDQARFCSMPYEYESPNVSILHISL